MEPVPNKIADIWKRLCSSLFKI